MFLFKKPQAEPKEAYRTAHSATWCGCGARIARCARCGGVYCPRCDVAHQIVWGRSAPVYVCEQGGAGWR
jgi:hypothetical protein